MTAEATETRTVHDYRHAARGTLREAREHLSIRTDKTKLVYQLLNGDVSGSLEGREGLSQAQQVEFLSAALDKVKANREAMPQAVAEAKESVLAAIADWDTVFVAALDSAIETLTEAKEFAETRDFDAWMKAKKARKYGYTEPEDEEDDPEPEEDEDDL